MPGRKRIPYGRQDISAEDIDAVVDVLRSDFLTQGPRVPEFENALSIYCGGVEAVAMNSATSALHLACLALEVGPGDLVWTSPISFVASANCALYCGADVDFVDIDPLTWNMSVEALREKLERAETQGRLPKVVIPVHLCGASADMKTIHDLSLQYGFKVLEDASHAVGGDYAGAKVGSCAYSDMAVFSFHPVKIMTTGEGGAVMTKDAALADRVRLLRSHGITRDEKVMTHTPDGPWYYQQVALGYNYRMTDIHAALGISQLGRVDQYVARRRELAARYDNAFAGMELGLPAEGEGVRSAWHLYVVRIPEGRSARNHKDVYEHLMGAGIGVNLHYIPIHLQPYYAEMGFSKGAFPEAEKYYAEAITLPLYPRLTEAEQDEVIEALK